MTGVFTLLRGDSDAERAVPRTGLTAQLTVFVAAAMAFLAVFALTLALSMGRMAKLWTSELSRSVTVSVAGPDDGIFERTDAVFAILQTTPGVTEARLLSEEEQRELLEPWLDEAPEMDALPLPRLIAVSTDETFAGEGLAARLEAEVPGAYLDDHAAWQQPLVLAAKRLWWLGAGILTLILGVTAVVVGLAAQASLVANQQVIGVLRTVGARDSYIAGAFMRRFTLRGLYGALLGTIIGGAAIALVPRGDLQQNFLAEFSLQGGEWAFLLLIPVAAGFAAYIATRWAAKHSLRAAL